MGHTPLGAAHRHTGLETEELKDESPTDILPRSLWEPFKDPNYFWEAILKHTIWKLVPPGHYYLETRAPKR